MSRSRLFVWGVTIALVSGLALPRAQGRGGTTPPAAAQQPGLPPSITSTVAPGQTRAYSGSPIDVDFQDSDLRAVLRQIADFGGINLVIDPSVSSSAKVDLTLRQVPWDQVLDVIVRTNQLRWEVVGNVVRVVSSDVAQKEFKAVTDERKAQEDEQNKRGVKPAVFILNYSKGTDIQKVIKPVLSEWGDTTFDDRTNTLVVRDLPDRLQDITTLVRQLDQPEPQVEIEARIVEMDRDSARQLGVQWGVNGRMTPDLGNTTNLAFPNSGLINGRAVDTLGKPAQQGPNDPRAQTLQTTGSAVNLPATGATSGIGLTLGAVNGAFNIDVALTALEHQGKGKILSTPRVTTQNNIEANITQGFTIPYQAVSNNTVTVQFRDAALTLKVKPHVTGANTVIMDVQLENGFPDFSRAVNGNPSISTQKASTIVLVPDSVTTVIGGIVITKENQNNDGTPGLSKLPLLGRLFKRTENNSSNQEIVIFITPRIIRG